MIDGSVLMVRHLRKFHTIDAADVVAVDEFLTPNGPSYKLTVRGADGQTSRVVAPVALLRGGHSALFTWILTRAPQATLDKGALKTLARLKTRGLSFQLNEVVSATASSESFLRTTPRKYRS
jgi:hypothetical protein